MSAKGTLRKYNDEMEWDTRSKLEIACNFIDSQGLEHEFSEFVKERYEEQAEYTFDVPDTDEEE